MNYIKGLWWIVIKENQVLLYTPDGKEVMGQITARVTETISETPKAFVKFVVNIAGNEEEMFKQIEELNK